MALFTRFKWFGILDIHSLFCFFIFFLYVFICCCILSGNSTRWKTNCGQKTPSPIKASSRPLHTPSNLHWKINQHWNFKFFRVAHLCSHSWLSISSKTLYSLARRVVQFFLTIVFSISHLYNSIFRFGSSGFGGGGCKIVFLLFYFLCNLWWFLAL